MIVHELETWCNDFNLDTTFQYFVALFLNSLTVVNQELEDADPKLRTILNIRHVNPGMP
jgi:hypothetical protein